MNRGTTLLEVVLSLALLASLMIVLTSWTRMVGAVDGVGDDARWRVAAAALLDRIAEDVQVGDFRSEPKAGNTGRATARPATARVRIEADELKVATRRARAPGGPVLHAYEHDDRAGTILLRDELDAPGRRRGPRGEPRVVLGEVESFAASLDEDSGILRVQLTSMEGTRLDRRFALR